MKKLISFLLLFFALNSFSQKEANFWYFGRNAALDFNSGSPVPVTGSQLNTHEGCSSFSDSNGNLLFYVGAPNSDARSLTVWDKNNNPMPNGTGLRGDSSSAQSALTVPAPGKSNTYYLFTVGTTATGSAGGGIAGFFLYEIDMTLNGNMGDIDTTVGNATGATNLSDGKDNQWTEKVTAVRGKQCNTYWVISLSQQSSISGNNEFYAYKVSETGVDTANPVISEINNFRTFDERGYLKVSPDGTKLVAANMSSNTFIFDFDDETGIVTNFNKSSNTNQLPLNGYGYGVEFSTSSERLYVSTGNSSATQENLFQFDLTLPTFSEISNSRFTVHSYFNSRSALQLGPNGKIYWSSEDSNNISVINNPNELEAAVNYSHQSVNLGTGVFASQGLPPFLSSLLLPIKIKDEDTDAVVNNQDLQLCIGQDKTIIPETISGTNILYTWTFNDETSVTTISSSATDSNLKFTNIDTDDKGVYNLIITLEDDCGNNIEYNATFNVEVFASATATKPDDINFCDSDNDGFNSFDLQDDTVGELKDIILTGLDVSKFDVLYFLNIDDANSGDNPLPNPYTNPTANSSQIIHARVQNTNAPNACFEITNFTLTVTGLPIPVQPEPYRICDDLESTSDTDEIINTFLLSSKDVEILGTLDKDQYNISYHTTQNGAEINDISTVIDKDNNHSVTNSQTVYIRVENKDNFGCYDATKTLDLIVDPLPVLKLNPELDQCISNTDTNPSINLTNAEINISETANVTFKYFEDAAGLNEITNATSYPVQVNTPQSVYVIVTSDEGCPRDIVELKLSVGQANNNNYNDLQPPVCDDLLDADGNDTVNNSDTDNITNFYLDKDAIVASINSNANTIVYFYENLEDRNNTLNEIDITNYRNKKLDDRTDVTIIDNNVQFPIYYKIISTINHNCQGLGQFNLQINATPIVSNNSLSPIEECDTGTFDGNFTNGSNRNIDLTQKNDEIFFGTSQDENDFDVTFYKTEIAASTGDTTSLDYISTPTQFTNDIPSGFSEGDIATQSIFVRVQNIATGCVNANASFQIIINPLPIITSIIPAIEVCDMGTKDGDVRNGLAQNIDISVRDLDVLNGKSAADFTVTYHKTQTDLEDLTSIGIDKTSYDSDGAIINPTTKISEESLFIRILNNNTGCVFDQSTLTIVVNPEPNFEVISNLSECDNNNDGDDANGIIQNIDLNGKISEILGSSQDTDDFTVTFHANSTDASTGDNKLNSPYENTNSTETIYVRIQNKTTLCVNDDATFDIIINSLPDFTVTTPQILCLNNSPLNIYVENPTDNYSYIWTNSNGDIISTDDNVDINIGGTYTVFATTTNGTMCTRTETIVVNESNIATLKESFITIIDESNTISGDDSISISIDTLSNDLGPGDYQFAVRNDDNGDRFPSIGFQDEPLFENLEGGIYTIIVNDKNGCSPDTELQISVIQFPKFFTPNSDGKNDTWAIKGANKTFYPNSSINIFNRYGKLIAQIPIDSQGWDGTYNGKILPSNDYWFNVQLIPADSNKSPILKKGHFSLLRR
jgi:gliding motility-associated-like protein